MINKKIVALRVVPKISKLKSGLTIRSKSSKGTRVAINKYRKGRNFFCILTP